MQPRELIVLAIDDQPDNLTSLNAQIKESFPAARVLNATNGPKGIELAVAEDPDAVLLDVLMPEMDGFEVCRKLKADARTRDIPVVFLTALRTDHALRLQALEAGAEAFLSKPIDETELRVQVRAMAKIKAAAIDKRDETARLGALVAERTHELEKSRAAALNLLEDLRAENEARRQAEERIKSQLGELQRWHDAMLGREDRVEELKREVNELCRRTGEPIRYPSQEGDPADSGSREPGT
jgi:response regulator RpfG family c-di-GMP phosphodiesterase